MILIKQNTSNNVVLTLNELLTLDDYTFLFEFKNEMTGEYKYFTAHDISPATTRYNKFTIIENNTENVYNGTVSLNPVGYWLYKIYEMAPTSPPNLDPTDAVTVLETGKVLVETTSTPDAIFDEDDEINNIVFE